MRCIALRSFPMLLALPVLGQVTSFDLLEKMPTRCARIWSHEVGKTGTVKEDSLLVGCFCYDKGTRRLDGIRWTVFKRLHGYIDSSSMIIHREYTKDGFMSFDAVGQKRRGLGVGDYTLETTLQTTQRSDVGLVTRTESVQLNRSRMTFEDFPSTIYHDTVSWYVDSLFYENGILNTTVRKRLKGPEYDQRFDTSWTTVRDTAPNWSRYVSLLHGRPSTSSTLLYAGGRAVLQIDSAYVYAPGSPPTAIKLEEQHWHYSDSMLVAYEQADWRDSYGSRFGSRVDGPSRLRLSPKRVLRRFEYAQEQRLKMVEYHETGGLMLDSSVYLYQEGKLISRTDYKNTRKGQKRIEHVYQSEEEGDGLPCAQYMPNGLPLVEYRVLGRAAVCERYEYSDDRPVQLPDGREFDWLKATVPR